MIVTNIHFHFKLPQIRFWLSIVWATTVVESFTIHSNSGSQNKREQWLKLFSLWFLDY